MKRAYLTLLCSTIAQAPAQLRAAEPHTVQLGAVVVEGAHRTRPWLIEHLLAVQAGQHVTEQEIERRVRRLVETGLFTDASWRLVDESIGGDGRVLHVTVSEAISLRPIFAIERGGARTRLKLGVRELNALGEAVEVAAWIERIDRLSSIGASLEAPYFLPSILYGRLDASSVGRAIDVYEDNLLGTFTTRRTGASAEVGLAVRRVARVGVRARSAAVRAAPNEFGVPTRWVPVDASLIANIDATRRTGIEVSGLAFAAAATAPVTSEATRALEATVVGFARLPWRINVGARVQAGINDARHLGQHYFIGGLNGLRGAVDGRYHGDRYWLANAETRVTAIALPWITLQGVAFVDAAGVASLTQLSEVAVGGGVRGGIPPLGAMLWRLDVGWSLLDEQLLVSFGPGQQF